MTTILQIVPELETGGAERTAVDIGAALVERGWRSVVASAGGRLVEQLEREGSLHVELPLATKNPFTMMRNATRLARVVVDQNVDLLHARSRAPAWSAHAAARRMKKPFVTTYHGAYNQNGKAKALYNSVMARGDAVIANSNWTAELIAERHPWARDRIVPIARGTDYAAFDPAVIGDERKNALREAWGLKADDDRFVFVHLARLTHWKGQGVVIAAMEKLVGKHPNAVAVLAGDAQGRSDYLDGLVRQIEAAGLEGKVILPGHCDDPAAAMALADAVIVASIEAEAFGRAASEAGALEKPAIVTRIGAVGETVLATPDVSADERTGWKVPPNDPQALAKAMAELMALTPEERLTVGRRARRYGLDRFTKEGMCRATLEVYSRLLAQHGSHDAVR